MPNLTLKILVLMLNILSLPAIFISGLLAVQVPIVLLYASIGNIPIWCLVIAGIGFITLPFLIFAALINSWINSKKQKYKDAIMNYRLVLLDLSIIFFLYIGVAIGLFKK
ncbi:MAG: hypothetical protein DCE90_04450 [Pseudanabaena sp.]|nr:MAG: hypothetical protein DCE90_04450 [Pseudanabaena sp.]